MEVARLLEDGVGAPASLMSEEAGLRHWDVVRALVEHGAVDDGDPSALHYAAAAGESDAIRALLDYGADRELADAQFGMRPAAWAEHFGHPEAAELLRADRVEPTEAPASP